MSEYHEVSAQRKFSASLSSLAQTFSLTVNFVLNMCWLSLIFFLVNIRRNWGMIISDLFCLPQMSIIKVVLPLKHLVLFIGTFMQGLQAWWLSGKEPTCQCRRPGFDTWVRRIPWRRKWQPTPVFLTGKLHGQRNLVGYSPWGHREWDRT